MDTRSRLSALLLAVAAGGCQGAASPVGTTSPNGDTPRVLPGRYLKTTCAAFCAVSPPAPRPGSSASAPPLDECPDRVEVPPAEVYVEKDRYAPGAYDTAMSPSCTASTRVTSAHACCYDVRYPPGGRPLLDASGQALSASLAHRHDWVA